MEAQTAFTCGKFQLGSHHITRRIFRNFQIIHTCHNRRKVIVWVLITVNLLTYNRQWRCECFEASSWQAGCSRYELQEKSLLFPIEIAENLVEVLNCGRFMRVAMVGTAAVLQCFHVPFGEVQASWSTENVLQLFGVENFQMMQWENWVESC